MTSAITLVEREQLNKAREEIAQSGEEEILEMLREAEPTLASYINDNLIFLAGRMVLSGVGSKIVRGAHGDVLEILLASVEALRHGHFAASGNATQAADILSPCVPTNDQRQIPGGTAMQPKTRIGF